MMLNPGSARGSAHRRELSGPNVSGFEAKTLDLGKKTGKKCFGFLGLTRGRSVP